MRMKWTLPLLFLATSFSSVAMDKQQMVNFSMNQMKADGVFVEIAEISGIEELRLEKSYRSALSICFSDESIMTSEDDERLNGCLLNELASNLGLSKSEVDSWGEESEAQAEDQPMTPLEALYAEMDSVNEQIFVLEDKDNRTPDEDARLQQLEKS